MANIIQFKDVLYKKYVPEVDLRTFINNCINEAIIDHGEKPDVIFYVDSANLFRMTSTFVNDPSPAIIELVFNVDFNDKKQLHEYLLESANSIKITNDNHKTQAYGRIVKSRLVNWVTDLSFDEILPIFYKKFLITGMNEVPYCLIIFTKYFN